jgi:hypothetical protein
MVIRAVWVLLVLIANILAYLPLVYTMMMVKPTRYTPPMAHERFTDDTYTAEMMDTWLGAPICSYQTDPDLNGISRTISFDCMPS